MENNTGIEMGDHVEVHGGFEDGLRGQVVEIDLSGTVKPHPRFTIYTDGSHKRMGGFRAGNLTKFEPDGGFREDTGFWQDGARSWVATMNAPDGTPCLIRIRDNSTSDQVHSDTHSWVAIRLGDPDRQVDSGTGLNLELAQQHAIRAVVWHGSRKED